MSWPQVVVALLSLLGFTMMAVKSLKSRDKSAAQSTLDIFVLVVFYAGYFYVLHAGGFW